MSRHARDLPGPNPYIVEIMELMGIIRDVRIGHTREVVEQYGTSDEVWLSAQQFLLLMDWGEEHKETLIRLAKEAEENNSPTA